MAATVTFTNVARTYGTCDLSAISITVGGNGATYATGSGGLPIDLAAVLKGARAQGNELDINYTDIIGILPLQLSTNKFMPTNLVVGTPTYQTQQPFGTQTSPALPALASVNAAQELATLPCTVRLFGTGSGNAAAYAEVADGANSDTFTALLLIARGGNNL